LTMLYRSTHRLCRAGAPVKYLTHNPSRSTASESAPSYCGTKQDCPCAEIRRALDRRTIGIRAAEDALQPLCAMSGQGRVGQSLPRARASWRPAAAAALDSSAVRAHRSASGGKGGERAQAIGRSRGGRTTKIHALTDAQCRLVAFMLTAGNVADCAAGAELLSKMPACDILHATKLTTATPSDGRSRMSV
jgi:hypothetical protein